jgi:S1-C subfamily serine protease
MHPHSNTFKMKLFFIILTFSLSNLNCKTQELSKDKPSTMEVNSNQIQNDLIPDQKIYYEHTFFQTNVSAGTGVICSYDGKDYFITAKHIFDTLLKSGDLTKIIIDIVSEKIPINGNVFFHENDKIDVAVIKLAEKVQNEGERTSLKGGTGVVVGQTSIFLGYPLGFASIVNKRAVPLVKQAIVSGAVEYKNHFVILLDGHNNPGFSGGPVMAKNKDGRLEIAALISGYFHDPINVDFDFDRKKIKIPINANSGIIISTPIERVIEIIQKIKQYRLHGV